MITRVVNPVYFFSECIRVYKIKQMSKQNERKKEYEWIINPNLAEKQLIRHPAIIQNFSVNFYYKTFHFLKALMMFALQSVTYVE